jgi:TolA-binding protein
MGVVRVAQEVRQMQQVQRRIGQMQEVQRQMWQAQQVQRQMQQVQQQIQQFEQVEQMEKFSPSPCGRGLGGGGDARFPPQVEFFKLTTAPTFAC